MDPTGDIDIRITLPRPINEDLVKIDTSIVNANLKESEDSITRQGYKTVVDGHINPLYNKILGYIFEKCLKSLK